MSADGRRWAPMRGALRRHPAAGGVGHAHPSPGRRAGRPVVLGHRPLLLVPAGTPRRRLPRQLPFAPRGRAHRRLRTGLPRDAEHRDALGGAADLPRSLRGGDHRRRQRADGRRGGSGRGRATRLATARLPAGDTPAHRGECGRGRRVPRPAVDELLRPARGGAARRVARAPSRRRQRARGATHRRRGRRGGSGRRRGPRRRRRRRHHLAGAFWARRRTVPDGQRAGERAGDRARRRPGQPARLRPPVVVPRRRGARPVRAAVHRHRAGAGWRTRPGEQHAAPAVPLSILPRLRLRLRARAGLERGQPGRGAGGDHLPPRPPRWDVVVQLPPQHVPRQHAVPPGGPAAREERTRRLRRPLH